MPTPGLQIQGPSRCPLCGQKWFSGLFRPLWCCSPWGASPASSCNCLYLSLSPFLALSAPLSAPPCPQIWKLYYFHEARLLALGSPKVCCWGNTVPSWQAQCFPLRSYFYLVFVFCSYFCCLVLPAFVLGLCVLYLMDFGLQRKLIKLTFSFF